ncbi:Cathepsin D [Gracilariopsis chorda]|uniref:Cathepsin D n=1 Tax=Gracilariopsis chorda TaxID=448386 RepID=A0A2V3J2A0_9FLOR|nr:Cathepsin D [Gracilariopsis chorda]|eukprot:PXF47520.1 Cathepsin D [Gracilariopsis chorda]
MNSILLVVVLVLVSGSYSSNLIHLDMHRRDVPSSRLFNHARRPWAPPSTQAPIKALRTNHLSAQELKGSIVPLGEYYITLLFGGQPINVQVDTGSSTIAVPLLQCVNCVQNNHRFDISKAVGEAGLIPCDSSMCRPNSCSATGQCTTCSQKTRACCSDLAPKACGFYLSYADQSGVGGALAVADVEIANIKVRQAFGAVLGETDDFEVNNVDGIFGMAYPLLACNPTCVKPLFDTILSEGLVERDVFSHCLADQGGTLVLGGSNPDLYRGHLQYVPIAHGGVKLFYGVRLQGVKIGGKTVKLPYFTSGIVDSGTTVLVVTKATYKALRTYFQSNYCHVRGLCVVYQKSRIGEVDIIRKEADEINGPHLNSSERAEASTWFSPGVCARLDDKDINALPAISILLDNGVTLDLEPDDYMLHYESESRLPLGGKVVYRCMGISPLEGLEHMGNEAIIGNTVLKKYYVEYDRENERVGFAEATNCPDQSATKVAEGEPSQAQPEKGLLPKWLLQTLTFFSIGVWAYIILACASESISRQRLRDYSSIPR